MASVAEQLTENFYQWEARGRGWQAYDYQVDLEPPFVPFYHVINEPYVDDGRKPGLWGQLFGTKKPDVSPSEPAYGIDDPYPCNAVSPLRCIALIVPEGHKPRPEEMEALLLMLTSCTHAVSFEIIADAYRIRLQFTFRDMDAPYLHSQLKAYFPTYIFSDADPEEIIADLLHTNLMDYGLAEEFMRPLAMAESFSLDPYTGFFGILDMLSGKERAGVQILFNGTGNAWSSSIYRSSFVYNGEPFFADAPEMVNAVKDKISSPLFAVSLRTFVQSDNELGAAALTFSLGQAVMRMSGSQYNSLIPLPGDEYPFARRLADIGERRSHRLGMLLNTAELVTLLHLPSPSVTSVKLERDVKRTKAAPEITHGHDLVLGKNIHKGIERVVSVNPEQRLKHMHVIGATGTGKSSLLVNCIVQDAHDGNGICVLDPHGDLIENILPYLPEDRRDDVILIDPSDAEYTVPLNILSAHSETEKEIIASDLVATFKRLSTSWGDQMTSVLANAILAFLESSSGGSIADLRRFLVEKPFREQFLGTVMDEHVRYYWQKEFPLLKSNSIGPILTRLDTFLRPKPIRNMVSQKQGLDFEGILNGRKILLVKLSQGLIGAENSYLLGTLILSKIHQAAMARQSQAKEDRRDFFCYIDEFQNFITPSMSAILSGARKYHLGLVLAHQDMHQVVSQDSELSSSVMANAGIRVCFRVSETDAKRFESTLSHFDANDLQNLDTGEAIARIERSVNDFNIHTYQLQRLEASDAEARTDAVIAASRSNFGMHIVQNIPDSIPEKLSEMPAQEPEELPKREIGAPEFSEEDIKKTKRKSVESQHRSLQMLLKRTAESYGYIATLEVPIPNGEGLIDIVLEKNGKKIAVEISVTTTEEWELHNVKKCVAAGYETIIVCSPDLKHLEKISELLKTTFSETIAIFTMEPAAVLIYLNSLIDASDDNKERIKGYRVKVQYNPASSKSLNMQIVKTISKKI